VCPRGPRVHPRAPPATRPHLSSLLTSRSPASPTHATQLRQPPHPNAAQRRIARLRHDGRGERGRWPTGGGVEWIAAVQCSEQGPTVRHTVGKQARRVHGAAPAHIYPPSQWRRLPDGEHNRARNTDKRSAFRDPHLAYAMSPQRDRRPYDGRNPTTPLYAAGNRTDPPVSEPNAPSALPHATATALPPLLPPCARPHPRTG
jgi:hypothetical protein